MPRLGALVRHLGAKMPQHLPRYPKKHHLGANIFQHSSQNRPKTASRTLQRSPNPPKTTKSDRALVVFTLRPFFQRSRKSDNKWSQDHPKSSQTEPKMAILAPSWPILGATCCQLGPSWAQLGPIFGPTSPTISTKSHQKPQEAPPDTRRPTLGLKYS